MEDDVTGDHGREDAIDVLDILLRYCPLKFKDEDPSYTPTAEGALLGGVLALIVLSSTFVELFQGCLVFRLEFFTVMSARRFRGDESGVRLWLCL